jgi:hypothetical protein
MINAMMSTPTIIFGEKLIPRFGDEGGESFEGVALALVVAGGVVSLALT